MAEPRARGRAGKDKGTLVDAAAGPGALLALQSKKPALSDPARLLLCAPCGPTSGPPLAGGPGGRGAWRGLKEGSERGGSTRPSRSHPLSAHDHPRTPAPGRARGARQKGPALPQDRAWAPRPRRVGGSDVTNPFDSFLGFLCRRGAWGALSAERLSWRGGGGRRVQSLTSAAGGRTGAGERSRGARSKGSHLSVGAGPSTLLSRWWWTPRAPPHHDRRQSKEQPFSVHPRLGGEPASGAGERSGPRGSRTDRFSRGVEGPWGRGRTRGRGFRGPRGSYRRSASAGPDEVDVGKPARTRSATSPCADRPVTSPPSALRTRLRGLRLE